MLRRLRAAWEKNWPELRAALTGGVPTFVFAASPADLGAGVPAFCYHDVDAEAFRADLEFLSNNGYATISADMLLDHIEGHGLPRPKSVVLTIDDGARSLHDVAFPLLARYGMRAVAFVAPRFHSEREPEMPCPLRTGAKGLCTWSQIRDMQASGHIDFQSHTFEHRYVPRWPEAADLIELAPDAAAVPRGPAWDMADDFRLAKEVLEEKLHKPVHHVAFPRFMGTRAAVKLGRQCGYRGFWWGSLPGRALNCPGSSADYIVRLHDGFLRRLPGKDRVSLAGALRRKYRGAGGRLRSALKAPLRGS